MSGARVMLFATAVVVLGCATHQVTRDAWYEERSLDATEQCQRSSVPVDFAKVRSKNLAEALTRLGSDRMISLSPAEATALTGKRLQWSSPRLVRALRPKYEPGSPWVLVCGEFLLVGNQGFSEQPEPMKRTALVIGLNREPRNISVTVDCCPVK